MSRKPTSIVALVIALALVFAAAGCNKKHSTAATATTTTTEAAVTTSEATTTTDTTTDTTATDTTATDTTSTATTSTDTTSTDTTSTDTTGTGTSSLSALTSAGNCADLANMGAALSQAFSGTGTNDVQKQAQLLKEFADRTPEDIRPDFETVADAYSKIADALKGVDLSPGKTPSPEVLAKLMKLSTELDQTKLTQAETNISAWASKNCRATP